MDDAYRRAIQKEEEAKNECVAAMLSEVTCSGENLFVTDEYGRGLSRDEVIKKLRRGDKK